MLRSLCVLAVVACVALAEEKEVAKDGIYKDKDAKYVEALMNEAYEAVIEIDGGANMTADVKKALTKATMDNMAATLVSMGLNTTELLAEADEMYADDKSDDDTTTRRRRQIGGFGGRFLPRLARFSRISPFSLFNRYNRRGFPFRRNLGFGSGIGAFGGFGRFRTEESDMAKEMKKAAYDAVDDMSNWSEPEPELTEEEKKGIAETGLESMYMLMGAMGIGEKEIEKMNHSEDEEHDDDIKYDMAMLERALYPGKEGEDKSDMLRRKRSDMLRRKRQFGGGFSPSGFLGGFPLRRGFFNRFAVNNGIPPFFFFNRFRQFGGRRFPGFFGRRFF